MAPKKDSYDDEDKDDRSVRSQGFSVASRGSADSRASGRSMRYVPIEIADSAIRVRALNICRIGQENNN